MKDFSHVNSDEIKAEVTRLRAEQERPELSDVARDAGHWGIDLALDELERRGDL